MKKFNWNLLALLFVFAGLSVFTSCGDDEKTYVDPTVVAPALMEIQAHSTAQSAVFTISHDADLDATYSVTATGVTLTSEATGSVEGTSLTVNFDAPTVGAGAIVVTVTDTEEQSATATAVVNVVAEVFPVDPEVVVSENIDENTVWTKDKVYVLAGRITVLDGVTLEIEAGTIIKGQGGTGANATALLVARGGKLIAEGTADAPIIFTSTRDEINTTLVGRGEFASPNLAPTLNGLWGGLIVLGKANISPKADTESVQIEGIPVSDTNGLYGGTDDDDNSGILKYISIRHGGANIGEGNEINGLTLGGVGSETIIQNIEIVSNQDDGIEFFGGTVNVTNLVSWNVGDDGVDTDQAWTGTLDNFVVITPSGFCLEVDGPEGTKQGTHTLKNGLIIAVDGDRESKELVDFDTNTGINLENIYFSAVADGQQIYEYSGDKNNPVSDAITNTGITFTGVVINATTVQDHVAFPIDGRDITAGDAGTTNTTVFGWTWASQAGKF